MHNRLQAGDGAVLIRQHQIIFSSPANGTARRHKVAATLWRLLTRFGRYYRKSHNGFLRWI
jgi:hypothetical protein